jgi:hypothetical protein
MQSSYAESAFLWHCLGISTHQRRSQHVLHNSTVITPNATKPKTPAVINNARPALVVICASAFVVDKVSVGMEVAVAQVI